MGDFDGDGMPDCARAAPTANDLSFFKGLGAGNYSSTAIVTTGIIPDSAQLLSPPFDMTADGRADLVFSAPTSGATTSGDLYLFFGDSDGTFSKGSSGSAVSDGVGIATSLPTVGLAGAFDPASGETDLFFPTAAHASIGYGDFYWDVLYTPRATTLPSIVSSDSGFQLGSTGRIGPPIPNGAPWVAVGDVDGDDNMDAIVILTHGTLAGQSPAQVYIGYGNGDRTFKAGMNAVSGTNNAVSVQAGDVNHDGKLDLLVGLSGATPRCATTVFYGDGAGDFSTTPP